MIPLCQRTLDLFAPLRNGLHPNDVFEVHTSEHGFVLDVYQNATDRMGIEYRRNASAMAFNIVHRLPEQKQLTRDAKDGIGRYEPYQIAATDCSVEILQALAEGHIVFGDIDANITFNMILQRSRLADECAKISAQYKLNKHVPEHSHELNAEYPLSSYQQVALINQQISAGYALFMKQGTGKTAVAVASVCNGAKQLKESGGTRPYLAIVACPPKIRTNWASEFKKFSTRPGRVTVLKGTNLQRVKLLCDAMADDPDNLIEYSVVIVGYQTLWRTLETLQYIPWDLAILDEAHAIKDVKTKQSQGCMEIRDRSKQRLILTGTPTGNSPLDLYNLLEFLEKGGSGFSSQKAFNKYYGTWERTESGYEVLTGVQNLPFLQERLARKSYFITLEEAIPDLPEKTFDLVEVEMGKDQQDAYNKLASELAVEIDNDMQNDTIQRQLLVQNVLTKLLRLSQITSGFIAWDKLLGLDGEVLQPKMYEYFSPNPKIEAVLEMLREMPANEKMIVWSKWIPDIEFLAYACEQNDIGYCVIRGTGDGYSEEDFEESKRRFNEDRTCRVCIGTDSSGGTGLNLLGYPPERADEYDTNCTRIVHFAKGWSSIIYDQSLSRAHRRGTRVPVRCTSLVVPDSIDTQVHERVSDKIQTSLQVSDLRKILTVALSRIVSE